MVDDNTNVKLITNLDMNSARIRNVGAPVDSQEAANKQYVDSGIATVDSKIDDEIADCLRDAKAYADTIRTVAGAPDWTKVINKPSYLDDDGPFAMDSQRVLIVDTNMSLADNTLHDVADPSLPNDAANKAYVDNLMSQTARPAQVQSMIEASSTLDRQWTNITDKPTWVGKMDYIATPTTVNPNGLRDNYIHVKTNVDMDGQTIAGIVNPTHASHAVPLRYLDTKLSELRTSIDEGAATGVLQHITRDSETLPTKIIVDLPIEFPSTSRKRIRYVADPEDTTDYDYDAVNKLYVDTQIAAGANPYAVFLTVDGTELAIANVKAPTVAKDASTKKYVDNRFTAYQPSWTSVTSKPSFLNPNSDGTYNHFRPIAMSSFMLIRNLGNPSLAQDAATKSYVDEMAKLIEASRGVLSARTLFRPKVTFSNSVIGDIDYASIVAADRTKFGARLNSGNYLSRSNIWITNIKVNISVFWGDDNDADLTDLIWDKSDEKVMVRNGPGNIANLAWDQTAATIRTSTAYTNKAVIVRMSPVIEAHALPSGSYHSFTDIDDYNLAPQGVYFTYTVPPSEVPFFINRAPPEGFELVNVTTTGINSIRVRGLNSITDDGGAVTISLHYNTTNDPLSSTTIEPVVPDSSGTYNITNLSEKTNYYIWVSARDSFNNDTGLMPVTGAQPATTQGTPPTGLSGVSFSSATANSITLGGLGGITDASYPVQFTVKCRLTSVATDVVAAQAQATITAAGSTPTITIPSLSGDTRYYLWLEATDNLGTTAYATLHADNIKTVNYDVWDFIVTQAASSSLSIELDRVQWDGTQALTASMFTYVRPGATTSNSGTPTVDLLLDSTTDTPLKWTPAAAPVGSTLFTIRTPIVDTDPTWTLSWWKPRNRPGLEIKKNGVRIWIDSALNLTGELPAPYLVQYPDRSTGLDLITVQPLDTDLVQITGFNNIADVHGVQRVSIAYNTINENSAAAGAVSVRHTLYPDPNFSLTLPRLDTTYYLFVNVLDNNNKATSRALGIVTTGSLRTIIGRGVTVSNAVFTESSNAGDMFKAVNMFTCKLLSAVTAAASPFPHYFQVQFPTRPTVSKYRMWADFDPINKDAPKNWTLEGSNDGTIWTTLDTRTDSEPPNTSGLGYTANSYVTTEIPYKECTLATPASYSYFRITVSATGTSTNRTVTKIAELELMGPTVSV